jgi:hypothetical protein
MDDLGADDPAADLGMHWHDREPCTFSREEGEVYGTYVGSAMSRNEGDDMLKWACNRAYRPRRLRFRNIRSLSLAVRNTYVPEGVKGLNFHERLDGNQNLMFYRRDLLPCIKRLMSRPNFANTLYTRFRLVRDKEGVCIIGAFNTGDWFKFASVTAQSKGGGRHVTVLPLFCSTDVSVARKKMSVYPFFVGVGCIGDKQLAEPGSWLMVACLPHYNDNAARAAKRPKDGPYGIMRRKVHCCLMIPVCFNLGQDDRFTISLLGRCLSHLSLHKILCLCTHMNILLNIVYTYFDLCLHFV